MSVTLKKAWVVSLRRGQAESVAVSSLELTWRRGRAERQATKHALAPGQKLPCSQDSRLTSEGCSDLMPIYVLVKNLESLET